MTEKSSSFLITIRNLVSIQSFIFCLRLNGRLF
jgi:hypothetical protein